MVLSCNQMKLSTFLKSRFNNIWLIDREETEETTRQEIMHDVSFTGANFWTLVFTMIIACVGLNMNSFYAIIGAMIMSPLMAPVIGMGYSISTNNWSMFKTCLRNWLWAFVISLVASTIYFIITPFSQPTEALYTFSKTTIYEIMLAMFGGLAAFVGLTREATSGVKVLAGVAVATACMPPLSTAGFGLAHMDKEFLIGGAYLYIMNCLYIGFAVMLLSKAMRFKKKVRFKEKPIAQKIVYIISFVSLIPATYFAYQLFEKKKMNYEIESFIKKEINNADRAVVKQFVSLDDDPPKIDLYLAGKALPDSTKKSMQSILDKYDLKQVQVIIHYVPDLEVVNAEPEVLKKLIIQQGEKISQQDARLLLQDSLITTLSKRMDSLKR